MKSLRKSTKIVFPLAVTSPRITFIADLLRLVQRDIKGCSNNYWTKGNEFKIKSSLIEKIVIKMEKIQKSAFAGYQNACLAIFSGFCGEAM